MLIFITNKQQLLHQVTNKCIKNHMPNISNNFEIEDNVLKKS